MQPKYLYKIYDITDTFVKVLDDVLSEPEFTYSLNGGLGELVLELDRSLDGYGEGSDLDFNYKVEVHLTDDYNDNTLIYTGYISTFSPYYREGKEGVSVTFLPNIAKLNNEYYRSGTSVKDNFDITWTATEIGDVIEGIIDNHRSLVSALYISNDYTNIDDTSNDITVVLSQEKHIDAIHLLERYLDTGWHWYIDASGKFYLKEQSATADHSFIIGKHVVGVDGRKNIEDVINTYFIWNGEKSGTVVDNIYQDATSQNNFDNIAGILVDSEMTTDALSDFSGNAKISENKDSKRLITVTISGKYYDIAGIRPGDTCKILNIDGNQTIFGTNMKIYRIDYRPTEVVLELIGIDIKPVLSTDSKSNDVKSVGGVTAQMVREAAIKANAGMHWDGDTLVIEGTIEAVAGNIGGWVIGATTLSSVDGDIILDSSTGTAHIEFLDGVVSAGKLYGRTYAGSSYFTIESNYTSIYSDSGEDVILNIGSDNGEGGISYIEHAATGYELGSILIGADLDRNVDAELILWAKNVKPADSTDVYLGTASNQYQALYLAQLAGSYPADEGAIFTKDDHHIYYRNNTAEVRLDTTEPAGSYLPLAGGTMAGAISMNSLYQIQNLPTPVADGDAARKKYVDDTFLSLAGGTMTGDINMGTHSITNANTATFSQPIAVGTPTIDGHATTKGYVDGIAGDYLPLAGGIMTGGIDFNGNEIVDVEYVLFDSVAVPGTPVNGMLFNWTSDGHLYYRFGGAWVGPIDGSFLPLSGGSMSGNLNMVQNDIQNITNCEIEGTASIGTLQVGSAGSGNLIDGNLSMVSHNITNLATPTSGAHAVNKDYVDDNFLPLAGGSMGGNSITDVVPVLENLASNPGSPANGMMYYKTTDNEIRVYVGGNWWRIDLTLIV